jgi:lipopolysaccharide transport system permease protein
MRPLDEASPPRAVVASPAPSVRELAPWTELRATRGWLRGLSALELWAYREVALALVVRDFRSRYKQAVLGIAWAVIHPVLGVVLFTLVFGELAGLPSEGLPYPVFVFAGLLAWSYLAAALQAATSSLTEDPDLVTKVYFPRVLAVVAAVAPPLVELAIGLGCLAVAMAIFGVPPSWALVTVPAWVALAVFLAVGVGAGFAALHVRFRDVGHALGLVTQLWFFATPIIFSSTSVDGAARVLLALNPATGVVDGMRWALVGGAAPPPIDLLSLATGALLVLLGLSTFQRMERGFADVI